MSRLENYHILSQIGEGSFGKVHKGRLRLTGQIVALKFINKKGKTEKDLNNLRQEINILRTLRHENIVHLIEAFETSAQFVLVTELAHGQLYDIIESDKTLAEEEVRGVARQLIHALNYLHFNRVIHRDIKPHNILIGADGAVKLCDFGFAKFVDFQTHALTSVKGTPLYMAPQLISSTPYKHVVDLWSLGVILFQLYFGHPPFHSNSWVQLFQIIKNEPLRIPEAADPDFKSLMKGLLEKNPDQRLQWPALFTHPFISKKDEKKRTELVAQPKMFSASESRSRSRTPLSMTRQISPFRAKLTQLDSVWGKYEQRLQDPKQASAFRNNLQFCSLLKTALKAQLKNKETVRGCLKCLKLLLFQKPKDSAQDVSRDGELLQLLLVCINSLMEQGGGNWQLVSLAVTCFGLLSKQQLGKEPRPWKQVCEQFMQAGAKAIVKVSGQQDCENVVINILKVVGLFANHASQSMALNSWFYKSFLVLRLQEPFRRVYRQRRSQSALKYLFHVFSVFLYPIYGELVRFPYYREYMPAWTVTSEVGEVKEELVRIVAEEGLPAQLCESGESIARLSLLRVVLQVVSRPAQVSESLSAQVTALVDQSIEAKTDTLEFVLAGSIVSAIMESQKTLLIALLRKLRGKVTMLLLRYEQNQHNLVHSMACLSILRALLFSDVAGTVLAYFGSKFPGRLLQFIEQACEPSFNQEEQILKMVGSCFGFPSVGLLDQAVLFLQRLLYLNFKAGQVKLTEKEKNELVSALFAFFGVVQTRFQLSAKALSCLFEMVLDLSRTETFAGRLKQDHLRGLLSFARPSCLKGLLRYPGVGEDSVARIAESVIKTGLYLSSHPSFRLFIESSHNLLELGFLVRTAENPALCQFMVKVISSAEAKQLDHQQVANLIEARQLLGEGLHFLEGVGVLSAYMKWADCEVRYAVLDRVVSWGSIRKLLGGDDPQQKTKLCSLVGCMTKNSAYYYPVVETHFIDRIIRSTQDAEPSVRRQAFFAVGNSAFHSAELYQPLRPAIPHLVRGLSDPDEKLRFNAAAALCNLARNGPQLVKDMVEKGAIRAMARMVSEDVLIAKRSALVSLSNILQYSEGKAAGAREDLERIVRELLSSKSGCDPQVSKYGRRVLQRLDC